MMPKKYEVAFVVYADIPEKDSNIGDLECNGTLKSYNCYSLRGARMYFTISASSGSSTISPLSFLQYP